jgi:hypothetical protein
MSSSLNKIPLAERWGGAGAALLRVDSNANGSVSLTDYVVSQALNGLFYTVGQEERKIRKDPPAQTMSLLKEVFGKWGLLEARRTRGGIRDSSLRHGKFTRLTAKDSGPWGTARLPL